MAFKLPKLPYDVKALEPHIDKKTMTIHYGKHHQGYTNKLNAAIAGTALEGKTIEEILKNVSKHGAGVRNNGGGFYNHTMFWNSMSPKGGTAPKGVSKLGKAMKASFKTFDNFKAEFAKAAGTRFGSGWAWLCASRTGKLFITSTPNQDNPLMDVADKKGTPILCLDVWEHAYYLKYQNKRPDYVQAFFNVVDWTTVAKRYNTATSAKKAPAKKKAVAKKSTAKKTVAKKSTAKKAVAKKAVAKKATVKKVTAKKAVAVKRRVAKKRVVKK